MISLASREWLEHTSIVDNRSTRREGTMETFEQKGLSTHDSMAKSTPLVFTDSAADKVKALIDEEGNPGLMLRVFVQGGGCSGFQYGFTFDEVQNDDDSVMEKNSVRLVIDSMSYQYLVGAEIDYKEDLGGSQFVIKNPNATTTCGCGSSFSV